MVVVWPFVVALPGVALGCLAGQGLEALGTQRAAFGRKVPVSLS